MSNEKYLIHSLQLKSSRLFNSSICLAVFSLIFFLIFTYLTGPIESIDTQSYSRLADVLISANFNPNVFWDGIGSIHYYYLRFAFISIVALLKFGFGEYWTNVLVVINCVSLSMSGYLLMRLLEIDNRGLLELAFIFLVNLLLYERFFWSRYILSDTSFCLISTTLLYFLYTLISRSNGSYLSFTFSLVTLIFACLYRPIGIVLIPTFFTALVISMNNERRIILTKIVFPLIPLLGLILLFGWAWYINTPSLWEDTGLSRSLNKTYNYFQEGAVIKKRPHTYLPAPESVRDIFMIELTRVVQFFRFTTPMFSSIHNTINIISFTPLYGLALIGIWRTITLLYRSSQLDYIGILSIIFVGSFTIFHSMFLIDYDWRYRLPCYAPIFLLASGGLTYVKDIFRDSKIHR